MPSKSLYIIVGEHSGDRHGAGLIQAIHNLPNSPTITFSGLGGPQMRALAPAIDDWVEEAAVVGLVEVLKKYSFFKRRFAAALKEILAQKPDAVVLIDYPGFNLRMAQALRKANFGGKIIYYISPQVWAWHRSRIPKMAQWLDLMLCIFPFEKQLYEGYGLRTEFTGHPLVAWHRQQDRGLVRRSDLIGFFPGSRRREILKIFPQMLAAAALLHAQHPQYSLVASAASPKLQALMQQQLALFPGLPLRIELGTVYDLMRTCTAGAVASGTATLEAAILGLPHVLVYKVAWPTYAIGKRLVRVPFLGMVNILANREIVPELIQNDCTGPKIAAAILPLCGNTIQPQQTAKIIENLGHGDAYARAASTIVSLLGASHQPP